MTKQLRIRLLFLCQFSDTPCIAVVTIVLVEEHAHLFDPVPAVPSRHLISIIIQSCPHRFFVLLCYFNILSNYRNCIICVPFMWSNAAVTTTAPVVPSHRCVVSSNLRDFREDLHQLYLSKQSRRAPGVVPRRYRISGSFSYTLQRIPMCPSFLHGKSTRKSFSGLLESIDFSYTFRASTRENHILSYTFHQEVAILYTPVVSK